jgi:formiminoglutamase
MHPVIVEEGDSPVVLAIPHGGTWLPDAVRGRLNARGRALADTDWHLDRLYGGLLPGATLVRASFHRYLIDANRDPAGASLYPGQNTTGLCPDIDFDGQPIWRPGQEAGPDEVAERRETWHAVYHAALAEQLGRVQARHGVAVLYDCHSIRSQIPFLFPGTLPVFNIGTNDGVTCAPEVTAAVEGPCRTSGLATVLNGRFRGGWTTRHYGRPAEGLHAIQMELAQRAYLGAEAVPWSYDDTGAAKARAVLGPVLAGLDRLARSGALGA